MKLLFQKLAKIVLYFYCLFFLVFYSLFFLNVSKERENLAKKIELVIFPEEGLPPEIIARIGENLRGIKKIKEVIYISKGEALKQLQENPVIKEGITLLKENPLPASFTVYPQSFEQKEINELVSLISSFSGVGEVIFNEEIFNRYSQFDTLYKVLNIFNFIFFGFLFLFLIFTAGYLFSFPVKEKVISTYFQQLLFSLSGTGLLLFLFSRIKLHLLKTVIFFNFKEIIFLLFIISIFALFLSIFYVSKNE